MKILALDLGTKTGIATNLGGEVSAYTKTWATGAEVTAWGKQRQTRRRDPRVVRFYEFLCSLERPDVVVFEDVEFSSYCKQTQMWSSLRTAVWLAFATQVTIECVPVTTLKKFATGSGNADKKGMEKHLFLQYPKWKNAKLDDNAIDALWIFYWAAHNLSRANYGK
jgi:Holliday junction resolvasome RuvABC endonuclease subunit